MRRTAKPFTIEVKKRGVRKREGAAQDGPPDQPSFPGADLGRNIRFRDAENLFRNAGAEAPTKPEERVELFAPAAEIPVNAALPSRRILPDLIAEAALSEQTQNGVGEPRRRGRPPKVRGAEALPVPKRAPAPVVEPDDEPSFFTEWEPMEVVFAQPISFNPAASARRRAARSTSHLPRGERWKRRLPRICR